MIGLLRWPFEQIGTWIESLVAPAPQVQFGVAGAVDEQEQAELDEIVVSVAADAAGTGPGAPATVPAPGHPDQDAQVDSVTELLTHHRVVTTESGSLDLLACHGCFWSGDHVDEHRAHQARLVVNMLRGDSRMSAASNKFRK